MLVQKIRLDFRLYTIAQTNWSLNVMQFKVNEFYIHFQVVYS